MNTRPLTSARSTARLMAGGDHLDGTLDVLRQAEILGEMVERAERQHAQRHPAVGQHPGHRADRAVAAAHDHGIELAALRRRPCLFGLLLDLGPRHESDLGRHPVLRECRRQILAGDAAGPDRAALGIDDHPDPQWLARPGAHTATVRSRAALAMTETELSDMAAAASIGLSSRPKAG